MRIRNKTSKVPAIQSTVVKRSYVMPSATIPVMEAITLGAKRLTAVSDRVPKIDNKSHQRYRIASFATRHNVFIYASYVSICQCLIAIPRHEQRELP